MANYKGFAAIVLMGLIFASCIIGSYVAERYLSPEVAGGIEDDLEAFAENEVEITTHAPKGSLKGAVDEAFPKKK